VLTALAVPNVTTAPAPAERTS